MNGPLICLCAISAAMVAPAFAQDAGALLRQQERRQETPDRKASPQSPAATDAPVTPAPDAATETIVVHELRWRGRTELLNEREQAHFSTRIRETRVGIAGLQSLADQITAHLQNSGHLLARALLPPQDVTEGTVYIEIVEGTLDVVEFQRASNVRVREDTLKRVVGPAPALRPALQEDLESALLRLNDLPGVSVRAKLTPGREANTSRLVVAVEQEPVFGVNTWGNNFGDPATGRAQGLLRATLTDLSGRGDQTRLTAIGSEGQRFVQASTSAPLLVPGLTGSVQYAYLRYDNRDEIGKAVGLEGSAHHAGASLDYTLAHTRRSTLRLTGGFNWKALVDDSSAGRINDKRAWTGLLAVSADLRDNWFGGALTSASLEWAHGDLDLSRVPAALANDAAGLRTDGRFNRLNASVSRLQDLPGAFSLSARAYGQWAGANLDSSEDFSLGGPYGLRAYAVGEGRGDAGLLGVLELNYDVPIGADWGSAQASTFFEAGRVRIDESPRGVAPLNVCGCNAYSLEDAGVGLLWTRKRMSLSASYAHSLGSNPGRDQSASGASDRRHAQQVWVQGAVQF